jgi:hypothetical protein
VSRLHDGLHVLAVACLAPDAALLLIHRPADFGECKDGKCTGGSYGGLFIRLAWHCSGSYR